MSVPEKTRIAGVYFYGYAGLDLTKIKNAFPLKAADELDKEKWYQQQQALTDKIKRIIGKPSTDIALVYTVDGPIVFVGIPGQSNLPQPEYNKSGSTRINAPQKIADAYDQLMALLPKAVAKKSKDDLDAYLKKKKELTQLAAAERTSLLAALDSALAQDRVVASYALGLVAATKAELAALVKLCDDSDGTVRNNSTRELAELLVEKPELASEIPARRYIEMLNSPTWTDRNKAVFILMGLTKSRDPKILAEMCEKALPSLKEMCNWPSGYSGSAIELLGRIAGISDEKLKVMVEKNQADEVLKALR